MDTEGKLARLTWRAWLFTEPALAISREDGTSPTEESSSTVRRGPVRGGTGLARGILITVLCGFLGVQAIDISSSPIPLNGGIQVIGYACLALAFGLQLAISMTESSHWAVCTRAAVLVLQAAITYFPLLAFGKEWGGMAGFLAGSVLLLVPGWPAWLLFGLIDISMLIVPIRLSLGTSLDAYLFIATIDTGLVVFGLSRLSIIVDHLRRARGELARMAIANERMRFARDLHDLLGYSLSAITLKAELVRCLVLINPHRAHEEIEEILDVARQALADVRVVASGYRNMSLEKEASAVTSLLSAAGIIADVEISCGQLDDALDTVLATVLREAVTNTLRHSKAKNCTVSARRTDEMVRLRVINDGAARTVIPDAHSGGLANIEARLRAVGGTMTAGLRADGIFELVAEAPIHAPAVQTDQVQRDGPETLAGRKITWGSVLLWR
jgi:two-component system, NarL family, sensor histidine kinase DesK